MDANCFLAPEEQTPEVCGRMRHLMHPSLVWASWYTCPGMGVLVYVSWDGHPGMGVHLPYSGEIQYVSRILWNVFPWQLDWNTHYANKLIFRVTAESRCSRIINKTNVVYLGHIYLLPETDSYLFLLLPIHRVEDEHNIPYILMVKNIQMFRVSMPSIFDLIGWLWINKYQDWRTQTSLVELRFGKLYKCRMDKGLIPEMDHNMAVD